MDESPDGIASRNAETLARCVAAQERASDVMSRAVTALQVAEERLKRARAARVAAINARQSWDAVRRA
jgi:hypothetical protein